MFAALAALACTASAATAQLSAAAAAVRQAIPVQGPPFAAALAGIDSQGMIAFRAGKQPRSLPMAELVAWGAPSEVGAHTQILLADGGVLAAEIMSSDESRLKVDSALFGLPEIPLENVAGVICHPPADARGGDLLAARLRSGSGKEPPGEGTGGDGAAPRQNSDRLILENGDELAGTITAIDGDKLQLKTPAGPVEIELDKVVAIGFNPSLLAEVRPRGVYCLVGFSDGSLLAAASLVVGESLARVTLAGGLELSADAGAVTFLQVFGGKAEYLSDLPSESYRHVPYLNLSWPFERDANVLRAHLRAGGRSYVKGIGMHSASRLTYRLEPKYRRFEAEIAIDDETDGRGSVVFRVFVDEREAYKSPVIRGGMTPTPISVDGRGGKRLSLIVDFAVRGDELDHADWLNARLVD
ncbi:MAG TPA: NPCBM/NEW2 domain-containing protein [Pirellulales bacterium]|nr:NPCBM/NEW2 domain-containing protein [Pirellulales bacterium]